MTLDGKRVLVVGGGSGIGFAVAEAAQREGALVTIASSNAERVAAAAQRLGNEARGALADIDLSRATEVFRVRFLGALAVAKYGATKLPPDGSLTLTDGMIAHRPSKGSFLSTGMAGGIEHLTRGLAVELAPVRVNCVCPAMIRTEIWETMLPAFIRWT